QDELVWLISPQFQSVPANGMLLSFDHQSDFTNGNDLEVRYSTDYAGYGNPATATWVTAESLEPDYDGATVTDLEILASGNVYLAFVYTDVSSPYAQWTISDLSITAPSTDPVLLTTATSLSDFTYMEGEGPSTAQSFELSGANLDDEYVLISLNGTDFEISLDGTNYDSGLELEDYNGEVTTIYARLKSGLAIGSYTDEISILGDNAEEIIVALEGSVTP